LYKIPGDLPRFKQITMGHTIVMGMNTFRSIGLKPLKGRVNVVVTKQVDQYFYQPERQDGTNLICLGKSMPFPESLKIFADRDEIFVIGGEQIYRQTIDLASKLYLTIVHNTGMQGDAFFPKFDWKEWKETYREIFESNEKCIYRYSFVILERL